MSVAGEQLVGNKPTMPTMTSLPEGRSLQGSLIFTSEEPEAPLYKMRKWN
jgi:hypothetical protein